jgi:hypothetical protein
MSDKWVDTSKYFGPDRRKRGGRRLLERRTLDEGGQMPPLGHMLRRLRVQVVSISPEDRERTMQLLAAAVREAERLHYYQCADCLKQADQILRMGGPSALNAAEARVVEAQDHAHLQR